MYLIEIYHRRDGRWVFSHTVNNYCFETILDAEAWIAALGEPGAKHEIVTAMVWRRK